jgi:hypothetical protein
MSSVKLGSRKNEPLLAAEHGECKSYRRRTCTGSAKAIVGEPKSSFGRVFNFKLGCFVMCAIVRYTQARPSPELKTRPRFRPVSLHLSMLKVPTNQGSLTEGNGSVQLTSLY